MNRCNHCKLTFEGKQSICPLCQSMTEELDNGLITQYPSYDLRSIRKDGFFTKLIRFVSLAIVLSTIYINAFTYSYASSLWSVTVLTTWLLIVLTRRIIKSKRRHLGNKLLSLYSIFILYMLILDFTYGFTHWSLTFVMPITTIMMSLIFTFIAAMSRHKFVDFFGYLLSIICLSFVPILAFLLGLSDYLWLSSLASFICLIIVIGLYEFAGSALKNEVKKKLTR